MRSLEYVARKSVIPAELYSEVKPSLLTEFLTAAKFPDYKIQPTGALALPPSTPVTKGEGLGTWGELALHFKDFGIGEYILLTAGSGRIEDGIAVAREGDHFIIGWATGNVDIVIRVALTLYQNKGGIAMDISDNALAFPAKNAFLRMFKSPEVKRELIQERAKDAQRLELAKDDPMLYKLTALHPLIPLDEIKSAQVLYEARQNGTADEFVRPMGSFARGRISDLPTGDPTKPVDTTIRVFDDDDYIEDPYGSPWNADDSLWRTGI